MKWFFSGIAALVVLSLAAIFLFPSASGGKPIDSDVVGVNIHWHPNLRIFVRGKEVTIPENIGIGAVHQTMHTHDDLPAIHLEIQGVAHKEDITLGRFFKIWGKDINSFGTNLRMTVNGTPNTEYGAYEMHDGDNIVLTYD